ncbi:MAG: glycerophosphodiester phosphodiesterase family protein [Alphaproteobacteria bacterium]
MPAPAWLTARPIAHRGLHNQAAGIAENSVAAATAAITQGYTIELDLLASADGVPMVFHDTDLDRLTTQTGPVATRNAKQLSQISHKAGTTCIPTLAQFLAHVRGQVPLVIEIKRDAGMVGAFEAKMVDVLRGYRGEVAVMSFHPGRLYEVGRLAPHIPLGLLASDFSHAYFRKNLSLAMRIYLRFLTPALWLHPQFIAYDIDALPAIAPWIARAAGLSALAWTVKSRADQTKALRYADQIIFEGFVP